jgi:hypothetical protein
MASASYESDVLLFFLSSCIVPLELIAEKRVDAERMDGRRTVGPGFTLVVHNLSCREANARFGYKSKIVSFTTIILLTLMNLPVLKHPSRLRKTEGIRMT